MFWADLFLKLFKFVLVVFILRSWDVYLKAFFRLGGLSMSYFSGIYGSYLWRLPSLLFLFNIKIIILFKLIFVSLSI